MLQAAFRGDVVPKGSAEDFQILASKEYGASYAVLELAKELGLDRALYSRKEAWVQDCLVMIVGRIVYAGSKLALSNQWKNTHRQIVELLERKVITAELFDEGQIVEVIDPEEPKRRYCLCRNPQTAGREGKTRERSSDR